MTRVDDSKRPREDPARQGEQVTAKTCTPTKTNIGCARLGSGVAPLLGVVKEEVAVLIALVRRHRRAVGAAVRRAVDDEVPGAVEEEAGPAAVRRVPPSGCAACTCPWCAWHRRCSTRRGSAPGRVR